MNRKYGAEQRQVVCKIREDLIAELNLTYMRVFENLDKQGLGEGMVAKVTQLILLSRDAAISPLEREVEALQSSN